MTARSYVFAVDFGTEYCAMLSSLVAVRWPGCVHSTLQPSAWLRWSSQMKFP